MWTTPGSFSCTSWPSAWHATSPTTSCGSWTCRVRTSYLWALWRLLALSVVCGACTARCAAPDAAYSDVSGAACHVHASIRMQRPAPCPAVHAVDVAIAPSLLCRCSAGKKHLHQGVVRLPVVVPQRLAHVMQEAVRSGASLRAEELVRVLGFRVLKF